MVVFLCGGFFWGFMVSFFYGVFGGRSTPVWVSGGWWRKCWRVNYYGRQTVGHGGVGF
jgi:hypothetical protein